jgi:HPt (histidine-containing phosphotransfer) domain-containing protein
MVAAICREFGCAAALTEYRNVPMSLGSSGGNNRVDSQDMIDLAGASLDAGESPLIAGEQSAIDTAHLSGMTLGDRKLEHEVLELFDRQAELLLARMQEVEPSGVASLAHTLAGSSRSIGAWRVAAAAEALEAAVATGHLVPALGELTVAVEDARRIICSMLGAAAHT